MQFHEWTCPAAEIFLPGCPQDWFHPLSGRRESKRACLGCRLEPLILPRKKHWQPKEKRLREEQTEYDEKPLHYKALPGIPIPKVKR